MAGQAISRAAGLVVYRMLPEGGNPQFLLLQASNLKHHWTPPKGHLDQLSSGEWEEELVAALRETEEEAGIGKNHLQVHEHIKGELRYEAWQKQKVVTYWLAKLLDPHHEVVLSHEHQDFKWADCENACQLVKEFPDMQQLLQKFQADLERDSK